VPVPFDSDVLLLVGLIGFGLVIAGASLITMMRIYRRPRLRTLSWLLLYAAAAALFVVGVLLFGLLLFLTIGIPSGPLG